MSKQFLALILFLSCLVFADTIDVGDAKLYYRIEGEGKPLIVLHGGPGIGHQSFLPYMNRLGAHSKVIFYDQRGCGKSTGELSVEMTTIPQFIEDLDVLRRKLGYEKFDLLGYSFGGFLAFHYAAAHPEAVDRLILLSPLGADKDDLTLLFQAQEKWEPSFKNSQEDIRTSDAFIRGDPATVASYFRAIFKRYCAHPEDADKLDLTFTNASAQHFVKMTDLFLAHTFSGEYNFYPLGKKLKMPTLIIHGDVDPLPVSAAEKYHTVITDSRLVVLKECGHFPYIEQPEKVFSEIARFLK